VVLQIGFCGGMHLSTLHAAKKADSQNLIYMLSYVAKSEQHHIETSQFTSFERPMHPHCSACSQPIHPKPFPSSS
jgi:hypothetical protein